ncbi:hypothetical protein N7492_005522 [Penicillium capsulatum]|uniref:Uncharacterized protein n=1 Tax=Penicillium capsulatum TaxID=69766 RepID=A0A9W9LR38_9EURO|nr:hypothetical protein N7492_005522 [Penicillium capsulatum]KAJ6135377.1 hypothetical protein N7512_000537 [Penicillium capsulatum]
MCPEDWNMDKPELGKEPNPAPRYRTQVTLNGNKKSAVVAFGNSKRLSGVGKTPEGSLAFVPCADLLKSTAPLKHYPTRCKSPLTCLTAQGHGAAPDCLVDRRVAKSVKIEVAFCGQEETRKYPPCDDNYRPIPTAEYVVDVFAGGKHSNGFLSIQPTAPEGVIYKNVPTEGDYENLPECSELPSGKVEQWPVPVKNCQVGIHCRDDCGDKVTYDCRVSYAPEDDGQSVDMCGEAPPGLEPCDLKSLGFLV